MKLFENILCVLTADEACRPTLARAVSLAENNQARLTVVEVVPPLPVGAAEAVQWQAAVTAERRQALEALTAPYRSRVAVAFEVVVGTGFLEVIHTVMRGGHDLVIKPAEDPKFIGRLFGSDDMHLLRKCPCPVWLTKPGESANYGAILAAVDFDPEAPGPVERALNHHLLELASSLALSDFAAFHLVHVWDAPAEAAVRMWSDAPEAGDRYVQTEHQRHQAGLERLRAALREEIGADAYDHLAPKFHLRRGRAGLVIPEIVHELGVDLVVMGTVVRTGIPGLLIGNTAETILEQLQCSVLAIKPPGFVSPVKL